MYHCSIGVIFVAFGNGIGKHPYCLFLDVICTIVGHPNNRFDQIPLFHHGMDLVRRAGGDVGKGKQYRSMNDSLFGRMK